MTCGKSSAEVRRSQSCRSPQQLAQPRARKTSHQVHFNPVQQEAGGGRQPAPPAFHEAIERLRNFESTKCGKIVNRGDSFRKEKPRPCIRRREAAKDRGSAAAAESAAGLQRSATLPELSDPLRLPAAKLQQQQLPQRRRVLLLGSAGVGKRALCRQFRTSEYTNGAESDVDGVDDVDADVCRVPVCLNGQETQLGVHRRTCNAINEPDEATARAHEALVIVYSVTDPLSFCMARGLCHLVSGVSTPAPPAARRPVILVANKCDLVRLRKVNAKEGRALALEFGFKYVETSVVINLNIDELLAGIVAQMRFHQQREQPDGGATTGAAAAAAAPASSSHKKARRVRYQKARTLPSLIVKEILHKVIGQKEVKSCDDLMAL